MISIANHNIHKLNSFLVSWLGAEKEITVYHEVQFPLLNVTSIL